MRFIFVALLCACAPPVSFITRHGLRVRVEDTPTTKAEVEAATEALVQSLGDRWFGGTKQTRDWLWGLSVWTQKEPLSCPGQGKGDRCYGMASEYGVRYQWFPCVAQSALIHELIHYLLLRKNNWGDLDHVSYELWSIDGIEQDARVAACYEVCPEVCK